jgi:hypothetical protein
MSNRAALSLRVRCAPGVRPKQPVDYWLARGIELCVMTEQSRMRSGGDDMSTCILHRLRGLPRYRETRPVRDQVSCLSSTDRISPDLCDFHGNILFN